jgi:hypothetical protein
MQAALLAAPSRPQLPDRSPRLPLWPPQVPEGAAAPLFPDDTEGLPRQWDHYGEVLAEEDWPLAEEGEEGGWLGCCWCWCCWCCWCAALCVLWA